MSNFTITTKGYSREYEHGKITIVEKDALELSINVEADLVISSEDFSKFCEEIQETIRKYCL